MLHRLDIAYPADHYGPLESTVTDEWTDRWGRGWLRLTIYVEDVAAWHDRFRNPTSGRTPHVAVGGQIIDVPEPHALALRR